MLQNVTETPGNAGWVKKILRESIYVDIREAEKTLSLKDIILDGINYTVHWRSASDQGKKPRRANDKIVFNALAKTVRKRKVKKT
ncbi:MAG: hypothetical protein A2Z27_04565 [candidate division Zixibacteria bacterium RBG_16_50_21]|nr:MAG: hypothetical protein A2Z27_04565 [candidate division Zixibacteria bacterium RBG_16_50_21]